MTDHMADPMQEIILKEIDYFREMIVVGTSGSTEVHRRIFSEAIQNHCRKLRVLDTTIKLNLQGSGNANGIINSILSSGSLEKL